MKAKSTSILALIIVLTMLLSACGGTGSQSSGASAAPTKAPATEAPAASEEPAATELTSVNIALEVPMSGGAGWVGPLDYAGVQIALDDYADDFAALGYEINLIVNDHEANNDTAASNFTKNVEMYKCPCVISSFTGPITVAAPLAAESKVLLINGGAQGDQLIGLSDYLYNLVPSYSLVASAMADYLYNVRGYTKLGALGDSGSTAKVQHDDFVAAWKALGGEVVADVEVQADATDYLSVCSQIVNAGADLILLANSDDALSVRIIGQFDQLGASDLSYVSMGTGNRTYAADYDVYSFVGSQKVYSTDEVIGAYENGEYFQEGYAYDNASIYISNYYNCMYIVYQCFEYCVQNGLDPTLGENLKYAMDNMPEIKTQGGTITLIEGNTVESPVQVFVVRGENIEDIVTYFDD